MALRACSAWDIGRVPTSAPIVSAPPATLVGRRPEVRADRLIADLVPPPRFDGVRFSSYVPNPGEPSQSAARDRLEAFAATVGAPQKKQGGLFRKKAPAPGAIGVYL